MKTRNIIFIVVVFLLISKNYSQETMQGELTTFIDEHIDDMPLSTPPAEYVEPNATQQNLWRVIIQNILTGNYSVAHSDAQTIGYRLIEFLDIETAPNQTYYILCREETSNNYWGLVVFNPNAKRSKFIIQTPHPLHDLNTGNQGFYVFYRTQAFAYMVSGTHRCDSDDYSGCDGTTSTCGSSDDYLNSDLAHTVGGIFQLTTDEIDNAISNCIFIQPHGYSQQSGDPDLIISNGTKDTPSGEDPITAFRDNLLLCDNSLTFKIAHIDTSWNFLIGRTNTQGRLLNNSTSPCFAYAYNASGKFIHFEQQYSKLRNNRYNWDKVKNAFMLTIEEENPGLNDYCLSFDGIDDYIRYEDDASLQKMNGAAEYTIEANIYIANQNDIDEYDRIAHRDDHFSLYIKEDRTVKFAIYSGGSWHYYGTVPGVLTIGEWNNIAVVRTSSGGTSFKIYINGIDKTDNSSASGYTMPASSNDNYLYVGKHTDGTRAFKGKIDNIRLKNIAEYPAVLITDNATEYYSDPNTAILLHIDEGTGGITANSCTNNENAVLGSPIVGDDEEPLWQNAIVGIQENILFDKLFKIYPNPAQDNITLEMELPKSGYLQAKIFDITGQQKLEIKEEYYSKGLLKKSINTTTLKQGIYILKISFEDYTLNKKITLIN